MHLKTQGFLPSDLVLRSARAEPNGLLPIYSQGNARAHIQFICDLLPTLAPSLGKTSLAFTVSSRCWDWKQIPANYARQE